MPPSQPLFPPVAVVGLACRFPGSSTPRQYWQNLVEGVESIAHPSAEDLVAAGADPDEVRDPDYVRAVSVLDGIEEIDAEFFGLSPREAEITDPQQRVFLECAWEGLENAGIDPDAFEGAIGVFASASMSTYLLYHVLPALGYGGPASDFATLIGNDKDYVSTRVSYKLGLTGPSVGIQTACSSSLVAVHAACQSLVSGECDLALAGGVTIRTPQHRGYRSQEGGYLSRDGRCRPFDHRAAGTVFGSGAGVVVLRLLEPAREAGDHVHAVVRGSAINNDGAGKVGFTAPSVEGQAAVIAEALAIAGVEPRTIGFVEAHGTGTPLGDPIEVAALTRVFGERTERPDLCALGSVKGNMGHLESAAGIAGFLKAVLALENRSIPPSLHFVRANPELRLEEGPFFVNDAPLDWSRGGAPRRAGVSSLGIGGTNAHVVLEEAPQRAPAEARERFPVRFVPLSGHTPEALRGQVEAFLRFLRDGPGREADLADIAYTATARRHHHRFRAAILGGARDEIVAGLRAFSSGDGPSDAYVAGEAVERPRVVFVFSGQGPQWWGMGRRLMEAEPSYRQGLEACDRVVRTRYGWSILEELSRPESESHIDGGDIHLTQLSLFAVQTALAELWWSYGIRPDVVVGHSMGEVAAAWASGRLTLDDAVRVIGERSRILRRVSGRGGAAAVELSAEDAERAVGARRDRLAVGAINGPRSTVLSGDPDVLEEVLAELTERGVHCTRLRTSGVAGHSPQVRPLAAELERELRGVEPNRGRCPMLSTVTGEPLREAEPGPAYWASNLHRPVKFYDAVKRLGEDGFTAFVEIAPHPVLGVALGESLRPYPVKVLPSLQRDRSDDRVFAASLAALHCHGVATGVSALFPERGRCIQLPPYAWQRRRHWIEAGSPRQAAVAAGAPVAGSGTSLLGSVLHSSIHPGTVFWQAEGGDLPGALLHHRIDGRPVLPAVAILEIAGAAGREAFEGEPVAVEDLELERPLPLDEEGLRVQVAVVRDGAVGSFRLSASELGGDWCSCASATLRAERPPATTTGEPELMAPEAPAAPADELYRELEAVGIEYGSPFRVVDEVWRDGREAVVRLRPPVPGDLPAGAGPARFDGALQAMASLLSGTLHVPRRVRRVRWHGPTESALWARALLREARDDGARADLVLFDASGRRVLEVDGLETVASPELAWTGVGSANDLVHDVRWRERPLSGPGLDATGSWLLVGDGGGLAGRMKTLIEDRRGRVSHLATAGGLGSGDALADRVASCAAADLRWVVFLAPRSSGDRSGVAGLESAAGETCLQAAAVIRGLIGTPETAAPTLCFVTTGAQAAPGDRTALDLVQAPLLGFARCAAQERPELVCRRIDGSPEEDDEAGAVRLLGEILASDAEPEVVLRGRSRWVPRLTRSTPQKESPKRAAIRADGSYLVTGGTGGLGTALGRWLLERGAGRVILLGRRAQNEAAAETGGVPGRELVRVSGDVTRLEDLERSLQALPDELPLRGVFHLAARFEDRMIEDLDPEAHSAVVAPKLVGAWNLHYATRRDALDLFVLFSSIGSVLGSAGQASYCAANAFLDALALDRRRSGLPALSVDWGPWAEVGGAAEPEIAERLAERGLAGVSPRRALAALGELLKSDRARAQVVDFDAPRWLRFFPSSAPLLEELRGETSLGERLPGLADRLRSASPGWQRRQVAERAVAAEVASVLRLEGDRLGRETPFRDLGLDSLTALELRNRLEGLVGPGLSATLIWSHPDVATLTAYLVEECLRIPLDGARTPESPDEDRGDAGSFDWISDLSEEEAERLLIERLGDAPERSS